MKVSGQPNHSSQRDLIRTELAATHSAFSTLVGALNERDLRLPSAHRGWSNAYLLDHLTLYLATLPAQVAWLRRGSVPRLHAPYPWLDQHATRSITWGARRRTPGSIMQCYDAAHSAAMALLDQIGDDEWQRGARLPSIGSASAAKYRTIEMAFRYHPRHWAEHAPQIRPQP